MLNYVCHGAVLVVQGGLITFSAGLEWSQALKPAMAFLFQKASVGSIKALTGRIVKLKFRLVIQLQTHLCLLILFLLKALN